MPRYRVSIDSSRTPEDVFAYLSAFDNIRDWDPSVASARRLGEGDTRLGSTYEVVVQMKKRRLPLHYAIVRYEPSSLVAVEARAQWFRSYDEIVIEPAGTGSRVTYDALLELKGPAKLATPFIGKAFRKIGDAAADGLRRVLG